MRFYLNELSLTHLPTEEHILDPLVSKFVENCIELKKIGYSELRSNIYPLNVQLAPGNLLATWVRNRSFGNRELKTRFKTLALNAPLFADDEEEIRQASEWATFTVRGEEAFGLGCSYLLSSLSISFLSNPIWENTTINMDYEYYDSELHIVRAETVEVNNVSDSPHIENHREFSLARLSLTRRNIDWNPSVQLLPNVNASSRLLGITEFYRSFQHVGRTEKTARARICGRKVAEMNFYKYDIELSKINTNHGRIRDIYKSLNESGRKVYLSVDVEKGAFEVCNDRGIHQREILFNGVTNGNADTSHNIKMRQN